MQTPQRMTSKRLRVFSTIIAALSYCVSNAGRLFVLVWFPCALSSACLIGLEWLVYGFPPRLPQWLMFDYFRPPSWLTPIVLAPFAAMAWAFVLNEICDRNPDRGIVTVSRVRRGGIRFELSPAVLIGTSILVVSDLLDGLLQYVHIRLLAAVYPWFEAQEPLFNAFAHVTLAFPMLVVALVEAWTYPIAAQVLRTGSFDPAGTRLSMRGNRLRLAAIFFLLAVVFYQLRVFLRPVTSWMLRALVDKGLVWTPQEAAITYVIDFPFDVLWTGVWAVTIAMVMKALATHAPSDELTGRTSA